VAHPDEPQRPLTNAAADDAPGSARAGNPLREALVAFVAALAVCAVGYVALAVPGPWFPSASPIGWSARELTLSRGAGALERGELIVTADSAKGSILVTVETNFRSADYRAIAWDVLAVPEQADVRMVWRTDYAPARINSMPIAVESGRLRPAPVFSDPNWVGRIRGLALAIGGPLPEPVHILGVAAKPMGALEVGGDRVREWLAFEGFTGTSINSITGGADVQDLPLPVLMATAAALAALAWFGLARYRARTAALPAVLATLFVAAWLLQDARWMWDLARQASVTARTYAGLDWRGKHLAAEDGPLFAFIERVRAKLPAEPVRVFMNADSHYFRGRGAYHLYPHNVFYEPYRNAIPARFRLSAGDYFVVYQRRGVEYDSGAQQLRWDGGEPISAELLLTAPGAALFRIR
jgi:hypothetical protein